MLFAQTIGILIAQSTSDSTSSWMSVIGSVANIGFAALVGWYLLTKALPKMQDDNNKVQEQSRVDFLTKIKEDRSDFLTELKEQRIIAEAREVRVQSEAKAALQAVIMHCEKESERRDENLKIEMSLISAAIKDQREVLEEVRDALRDLTRLGIVGK